MARKAGQFKFPFSRIVVTINNVQDKRRALHLAAAAVQRREINEFLEVEKCLPRALEICGLQPRQLGAIRHYIDFALVAVVAAAPGYLLYCCAEVEMVRGDDWITPALDKLEGDSQYLVANPAWGNDPAAVEREALYKSGEYFVGHGFSDQCFLLDAARLAKKVYGHSHESGSRYPLSGLGAVFEQRVDAYMRHEGLLRLTDPRASYNHIGPEGLGYPRLPIWRRIQRKIRQICKRGAAPPLEILRKKSTESVQLR